MVLRSFCLGLALSALLWAQRVDSKVVVINGRTYTGAEVEKLVDSLDLYEREMAHMNLPSALKFYALRERLAVDAEKARLADESPYREELADQRVGILTSAEIGSIRASLPVKTEDLRKYYDEHKDELEQLRFKLLFVAFDPTGKPGSRSMEEAKARVVEIQKKLADGVPFVDLVKQYSDAAKSRERGGDYAHPINHNTVIPGTDEVVPLLFSLLPGKVSLPVQVSNGFDFFQVTERNPPTFEQARQEIEDRLRTDGENRATADLLRTVKLELIRPDFFGKKPVDAAMAAAPLEGGTVVAKLNGREISVDEVGRIANVFPPTEKERVLGDKQEMLRNFGLMELLAARAEQAGYATQSPYRERLATSRVQVLAQAQMNKAGASKVVHPEDQQAYYKANPDLFAETIVIGAYLPFGPGKRSEAEAKARAEEFRRRVVAGGNVQALIKEYSEDPETRDNGGQIGPVFKTGNTTEDFKGPIFALKTGEWSQPLKQPNGFYVMQSKGQDIAKYEDVKQDIYKMIQQAAFNEYMAKIQGEVTFKILDTQFFAQRPGGRAL